MGPRLRKAYFQIFVPANIDDFHWYLAIINTKVQCIQVLDSLGPGARLTVKTSTLWLVTSPTPPYFDKMIYVILRL